MADIDSRCQELLDEYQALRRRLEEDDFMNPDIDDAALSKEDLEDRERLEELKEMLEDECDIEILDDGEADIDLPDHADGPPSEPMGFDAN
ncbi:MAG: hypothetical protein WD335_02325 [Candidatus Paceibacterota bacterium]